MRVLLCLTFCIAFSCSAAHAQVAELSGGFVHMGYSATDEDIPIGQLPLYLDELEDLRYDTIIITPTRVTKSGRTCATSVNDFEWVKGFPAKLGTILNAAAARNMNVIVGTTYTNMRCASFWGSSNTAAVEADAALSYASLAATYGSHPAFLGWYIPDEPGPVPASTYNYYSRVTAKLKAAAPGKPVMVAPYLGSPSTSPSSLASAANSFRNATGIDVQIWQDGVGANPNAKLFFWTRSGYSIDQYYQALASQLGVGGLWADVELFNYGDPLFATGAYRSTSAQRVNNQLWSARFAGKRVSWLNQFHMSEVVGPGQGYVESPRLMGVYRAFYGLGATLLFPLNYSNYSWVSAPSSSYPDTSGYELFDRHVGDPRNPLDPTWVGVNGTARVTIDFGSTKRVDWVGVQTLTYPSWGIRSPVTLDIYCGPTTSSLTKVATATAPFTQADLAGSNGEEYVLGNRTPLGVNCRFLDLRMPNGYWTFIGEVEASRE